METEKKFIWHKCGEETPTEQRDYVLWTFNHLENKKMLRIGLWFKPDIETHHGFWILDDEYEDDSDLIAWCDVGTP